MKTRDIAELLFLAAIWGASFLFMRISAPEFGAVALAGLRVAGAALVLLPLVARRGQLAELRQHAGPLIFAGFFNSALPFALFAYAALSLSAGMSSILNATTPMWAAIVAWAWLGQRMEGLRILGLVVGFGGVAYLSVSKTSFQAGGDGVAMLACLAAASCYGIGANYVKRNLSHLSSLTVSTGNLAGAALVLALPTALTWPAQMPGLKAWACLVAIAVVCSALAYLVYFRLMARVGPTNAITVTFLNPVFAVLWGWLILDEVFTVHMATGCAIVLLGTAMAVGLIQRQAASTK